MKKLGGEYSWMMSCQKRYEEPVLEFGLVNSQFFIISLFSHRSENDFWSQYILMKVSCYIFVDQRWTKPQLFLNSLKQNAHYSQRCDGSLNSDEAMLMSTF